MKSPLILHSAVVRYGLAAVAALAAVGLLEAMSSAVGADTPYITLFPAMMLVAVTLGAGPGALTTLLGLLLIEEYIVPPDGVQLSLSFLIRSTILLLTCLFVGRVSQRLRDARARADATAEAAHAAEAALRREVELVDAARAAIIAQEMQRVMQTRQAAVAPPPPVPCAWPRFWSQAAGAVVAAVGTLAAAGWAFGAPALTGVVPGFVTMKINTALCLVLAGVGVALHRRRAVRLTCAALVGVAAGLSLVEYATGFDLHFDQLLVHDPGDFHTVPGRMAQSTAFCFLWSAAALALLELRGKWFTWIQQGLSLGVAAVGLTVFLGYVLEAEELRRAVGFTSMALNTAVAFILLAVGLLCTCENGLVSALAADSPGARLACRLLPMVLLAPMLLGWLHVMGERADLFGSGAGAGLFTIAIISFASAFVWWTAGAINREDAARRATEMQLRNQAALMDHARESLIVRELGGPILFWNRGAETLYGWPAADAVGQRLGVLLRTDGRLIEETNSRLERSNHWEGELTQVARDGRRVIVESSQTATRAADGRLLVLESDRDVTERRRTEEAMRLLSGAVEAAANGIAVTDREGKILWINAAFTRLTGYSQTEAVGRNPRVLKSGRHPPEFYQQMWATILRGEVWRGEVVNMRKDGGFYAEEMTITPVRAAGGEVTHFIAVKQDVTDRKEAQEKLRRFNVELEQRVVEQTAALRAAAAYARSLIEASLDPLVTISAEGKITDVNRASAEVTGRARGELIGTDFSEYFTEPAKAREGYQRVFSEGFVRDYPLAIRHAAGRTIDVLYNATVYRDEAGEVQGAFAAARDITERKKVEAELARHREHLEDLVKERTAELARSNEELERFAYVASHDLQEPLRAVSGYLSLIETRLRDKLDEKSRHHIAGAIEGAARMETLIRDLLSLSRVGTQGKAFEPANLTAVLRQTLGDLRPAIQEAGASVTFGPLPTLAVDASQVAQLFRNLIGNAIKFRGDRPPEIHVSAEPQAAQWLFAVRDNGMGIESQHQQRIFVMFQRLHTRKQYPGTGIGLAICKKIVERHGGAIWVNSEPGQGSTFHFTLPSQQPAAAEGNNGHS